MMKNFEETPVELYALDALGLPLFLSEGVDEITAYNLACEFCRRCGYSGWQENRCSLYLLRGTVDKNNDVLFGLLEVGNLPEELREVTILLQFYNQQGEVHFKKGKKRGEDYRDYVIRSVAADCGAITRMSDTYFSGRGGSHVWIAERVSGRRVFMIQLN